jgi:class 3 adenylate cyclase/tetratricopeptide (TPR) repeat protein
VLFTDLVGSTELRSRLGEQDADELRRSHDRLLTAAVTAHGGRVVKGLGDGIMATFPAAADAVAGAVAIQQGVDRHNRAGHLAALHVRVGVSLGDVVFEDDDVHGLPVIEAARLCGAAAGDEILASELVRALAGATSDAEFAAVGPLELKGLAAPVNACRVVWGPTPESPVPLPILLTDVGRVFVGREPELARLGQLAKEVAAGERRIAFLAGEPGVGKTRLAAELAAQVHDDGWTVLAGRCDEDLGVPYQPFVEALRHFVDHLPPDDLPERLGRYAGELARLVPEVVDVVPGLPAPVRSDPETERYRLFDAVAHWLGAVSVDRPVLLLLDDVQWAAKPTLLLLRHVVQSPEVQRVLVAVTYRDTELTHDHPLVELVADLRRQRGVQRLPLAGLDDLGVTALVEQVAGQTLDEAGLALARAIYQETEGNPFFVREVLRHLTETGEVEQREGNWTTLLPVEELGIPEGVRDVVGRRLARLADETNQVLRMAAVAGAEFDVPVLQATGSVDEEGVLTALEEACAARLVIEVSATRYRFAHALVRDTLYQELTAARRVSLHRRVALAIESCHAHVLDDHLPALAYHWARASAPAADTARAVHYAARAGERALSQLAYDEAVRYYREALELLAAAQGPIDRSSRLGLLIGLGDSERQAGDPRHRVTLLEAARLAQASGDIESMGRAALALNRGFFSRSQRIDAEVVSVLEDALSALPPGDSPLRARLMAYLAAELCFAPDDGRRHELADEALVMARRLGDPAALGHVLALRGPLFPQTDPIESRRSAAEMLAVATQLADPALEFWAHWWDSWAALAAADMRRLEARIETTDRIAYELNQPFLQWVAGFFRGIRLRIVGRLEEAETEARSCLESALAAGVSDAFRLYGSSWFRTAYHRGQLGDLTEPLARAAQRAPEDGITLAACALVLYELGRESEARDVFDRMAGDGFTSIPANFMWLYTITMLGEVCAGLHDTERAAILYGRLAPYRSLVAHIGTATSGCVAHYVGLLAATLGRFAEADAHFAEAARVHDAMGAPVWLARTQVEWARTLLARAQPGDAERARQHLGHALATARAIGLGTVERRAVDLLR